MKFLKAIVAVGVLAAGTAAFADGHMGDHHMKRPTENLVEVKQNIGKFDTLIMLAKEAGLAETLMSDGPFTIFAPNDDAFAKLPKSLVDKLLADKDLLREVLLYHAVPGNVMAKDLRRGHVKTAQGENLRVRLGHKGEAKVNSSVVLWTDVMASNGTIHVINSVMLPPSVARKLGM